MKLINFAFPLRHSAHEKNNFSVRTPAPQADVIILARPRVQRVMADPAGFEPATSGSLR